MNCIIAVNATALTTGGGLSILQQFVSHAPAGDEYYIFVSETVELGNVSQNNIHFIRINNNTIIHRLLWDWFGLSRWFKKRGLTLDVVLSLQNTSVSCPKKTKQLIYLHQGLCLHPKKWSFTKKSERALAFYKYIYPFFVFLFANKSTRFIVQTHWMKTILCEKFDRCDKQVHVIKPDIMRADITAVEIISLTEKHTLFYPANSCSYKNYQELVYALSELQKSGYDMSSIGLYLTIEEDKALLELIARLGVRKNIHFLGILSYNQVLSYYKSCTTVVFPSYIESFGLPLLEAAMFGKPIVVADEAYARDVLSGYSNVLFVAICAPLLWRDAIIQSFSYSEMESYIPEYDSNWQDLFQLVGV